MSQKVNKTGLVALASAVVLLGACSGNPKKNDTLDQANASYTEANENPVIAKHAALELDNASKAVANANNVWKKGSKKSVVDHYAYVAQQRVEIAVHRAGQIEADESIKKMKVERQMVQIDARAKEADMAKQEALVLQKQMQELQAKQTERGLVMTLGDVLFDSGEATLAPGATHTIAKIGSFMKSYPEKTALIEGHTDSNGGEDFNYDLSVRRTAAVRAALIREGIAPSRISTKGFGEALPVASNNTASGRQQNRRVEIIFTEAGQRISALSQ